MLSAVSLSTDTIISTFLLGTFSFVRLPVSLSCFSFLTSHSFSAFCWLLFLTSEIGGSQYLVLRMFLFLIYTHSLDVLIQSPALNTIYMPAISTWIAKKSPKLHMSQTKLFIPTSSHSAPTFPSIIFIISANGNSVLVAHLKSFAVLDSSLSLISHIPSISKSFEIYSESISYFLHFYHPSPIFLHLSLDCCESPLTCLPISSLVY